MPKDKDQPEEPYIPSAFEAHHLAEAMRKMLGSMMDHVENLGVDVEGMAAMVPLASGMQAERKRRGASYKEVAEALKVRQRDIKAIEAGSPDEVDGKVLVAYADWLGMGDSLRQWIGNHPKYAAKMGLAKSEIAGESTPSNVIPFQADMPPGKGAPKPLEPGEALPITEGETETPFGGMDLINKLVSGDSEMMASLEAEFSKFDVGDAELFESVEPDIDELTANPALPATYEFEMSLLDIKPRIWRRFRVSNELTFQQFHEVVQVVMGWTDSHLHAFDVFGATIEGEASFLEAEDRPPDEVHDARKYQLCDFNLQEKDEIGYEYDFGDGWEHAIVLKKILPADPTAVPVCLKGKRACPLEDSHGPFGYQEMLKALVDKNHPSHEEWVEWTGGPVDSETFDVKEVNEALAELPSHWKARRKERSGDK